MENKYKINTNWSLDGRDEPSDKDKPSIYRVIIDLIDELKKSLEVVMMKEYKSDEEIRKILNNPEGITIKELQIIDTSRNDQELRKEARGNLDWAYGHLSAKTAQLIATRNDMPNRSEKKNKDIDAKNGELKNTIISQYKIIEKLVEDYEKKEELSEKERKELVYIREVYSKALSEIIKSLFLTAAESTERVRIFPREEQKETINKIISLQRSIWLLTKKDKKNKSGRQFQALQQQITQLQNQESDIVGKLTNLIKKEVDDKTSLGGLSHAETRFCLKKVVDGIEEIKIELKSRTDLRNSNERENKTESEYQNQQIQLPKK